LLAERVHQIELIEHMAGVVRELRAEVETLGILTANSKDNVLAFLTDKNLTVFDFISTVPKLSGKAKKLKAIMGTFDYKEEELLFIGDEIRDVRAAHKAGVPVAAVTWGFNSERSLSKKKPDLIFREPAEILDHFRNGAYRPEDAHG
jgi:phosphoglycolate phosphatase